MDSLKRGTAATNSESVNKKARIEKARCRSVCRPSPKEPQRDIKSVMEELEMAGKQLHLGCQRIEDNAKNCALHKDGISPPVNETHMPLSNDGEMMSRSEIDFIPGVVNRIIVESTGEQKLYMRTHSMTKVLLSLILKFAKPFLAEQALQSNISQSNRELILKEKNDEDMIKDKKYIEFNDYKKRVVVWAVDRIQDLLSPNIETRIPALDALLAATGGYDSLRHETVLQDYMRFYQDDTNLTSDAYQHTKSLCMGKHELNEDRSELWWLHPDRCLKDHEQSTSTLSRNDHTLSNCRFFDQMKYFLKRHDDDVSLEDRIKNKNV